MSDRIILIMDREKYEVRGDSVQGYRDETGKGISGPPEKITGDSVQGFRDWNGERIQLRKIEERKD